VSVLLPVWNAAATLPECVESLLAQSLREIEVVAVDDGSTDGSREWLLARARAEPRLRVLARPHRGLVAALNPAARAARAPFLARMDADDVAHRERLRLQLSRLLDARTAQTILGARVRVPGRRRGNAGMRAYVRWSNRLLSHRAIVRDMFVESPLVHPSVMLSRQLLLGLGGYREGPFPEDYDLWLRALQAGVRFAKCPEVLLEWRDLPGRLTRSDPRYSEACFRERKLDALLEGVLRRRAAVVWGAGPIGKGWARSLRARGVPLVALVEVAPRKLGQRIHGAPVLDVERAARLSGPLHLLAVGQPGARRRMRALLGRAGLVEGGDFVAVA
jgi:glycosyltransferase involved in cell wall biosynthesis